MMRAMGPTKSRWGGAAKGAAGVVLVAVASGLVGCAPRSPEAQGSSPSALGVEEAQRFVLALINRDRAAEGLPELGWDAEAARAAERHVRDMAAHGFTAHWGTDGSVPEQRYSEAGGRHLVRENAACFFDGKERALEAEPRFEPAELEKIHDAFMSELPPEDGHRRNLLDPKHSRAGIGLAKPQGVRQPCMAQELVGVFGEYDELPRDPEVQGTLHVAGEVHAPVTFGGVGVKRLPLPRPLSATELNQTSTYPVPEPDVVYFPPGFKTPLPVLVKEGRFQIDVPLGEPGLYEISIWGRFPEAEEQLRIVSLRTVRVD